ncbi:RHS repeat protein, partial [Akkermansia glycaniphila]|nr:RHS repeat protein [Akkermansia glycaniphila]
MSSQQSPLHPSSGPIENEADLAMNGYLPEGWAPFIPGDANTAAFALTEYAADSSSSDSDSSSSSDDSSSSDWDDSSSSDDDSSSGDWDDSSSDPADDKPDDETDQFCKPCACACSCGKDNVASESFFTDSHLGSTQDVAMNIVFGIEPDIAGWCPAIFQVRDINDNSSSFDDPDYNITILDSLGFTCNHVSAWSAWLDPYSNLVTITKPSGKSLYYRYAKEGSTAQRAGETQKFSSLVQLLDNNLVPRTNGKPAYADFTTGDGASIRFNLSSSRPIQLTTADQVVVNLTAYENKLKVKRNEVNHIRSVWHHLDGLINIRETYTHPVLGPVTEPLALIEWYPKNQITPSGDWYATTGAPGKTWYIQQEYVTKDQKSYRHLAMMSVRPGSPVTRVDRYLAADETVIDMPTGEGDRRIRYSNIRTIQSGGTWQHLTTRRMTRGDTTPTSSTRQIYKLIDGIWQETSRTEGYGTSIAQTTTYTYADLRLSRVDFHDGGYRRYEYDGQGRIIMEASPWAGGISPDTLGQGEQITATSYADLRFNDYRPSSVSTAIRIPGGMIDTPISQSTYTYSETTEEKTISVTQWGRGADEERITETVYHGPDALPPFAAGRMKMTQGINGVQTVSSYAATTAHGAAYSITTEQQVGNQPVAGQSTRTVSYIAEDGTATCTETYAHTGNEWSLLTRETYEYDIYRNRTKTVKANGRTSSTEWMCCGPLREIDEDGVVTTYSYNAAHQLIETIRSATTTTPESIVSYTRDAAGRATATRTDIGPMTTTTSVVYDVLGRTVSTTDELGRTTGYEYSVDGLTETVTLPTGAITITKRHADGQTLSITGNAQQEKKYELYLLSTGLETWSYINHENNWLIVFRTKSDGFGQTIQEQRKAVNQNDDFITTISQYNAKGQLVSQQTKADGSSSSTTILAPVLYAYDAMGNMVKQTVDLSPKPSRITEHA